MSGWVCYPAFRFVVYIQQIFDICSISQKKLLELNNSVNITHKNAVTR